MPQLITPSVELQDSWLSAREEFGVGVHQDGAGLSTADEVTTPEGFVAWVARLRAAADPAAPLLDGQVHAHYWWIVDGSQYIGAITLRHALTPALLNVGGHIGYSIRPSARRRGFASWALAAVLDRARHRGLARVLITCDHDNVGSARVIEVNGGVLEDIRPTSGGPTRRYWIQLA